MSKNNVFSGQLEECIAKVILPMGEQAVDTIEPSIVAKMVDRMIDPERLSPELKTYSSYQNLLQTVRSYLRRHHDPVQRAADADPTMDLFGDVLQPRYPVDVFEADGTKDKGYRRLDLLTDIEAEKNCKRMERSGNTLLEHTRALRAYMADKRRSEKLEPA